MCSAPAETSDSADRARDHRLRRHEVRKVCFAIEPLTPDAESGELVGTLRIGGQNCVARRLRRLEIELAQPQDSAIQAEQVDDSPIVRRANRQVFQAFVGGHDTDDDLGVAIGRVAFNVYGRHFELAGPTVRRRATFAGEADRG